MSDRRSVKDDQRPPYTSIISTFRYDVFISYAREDLDQVLPIAEALRTANVNVWLDQWLVRAGDNFKDRVLQGIRESRRFLFCATPAAVQSEWVEVERTVALKDHPSNRDHRLIPLMLADCELPDEYTHIHWIDAREMTPAVMAEITRACLPPSPPDPPPPPLIQNIPARQNLAFCGRDDILDRIHKQFLSGSRLALTQVIHGLGGLGKTQIALEYAYRYAAEYHVIWWVRRNTSP